MVRLYNYRLLLDEDSKYWLRIQYSKIYENPITNLKIIECDTFDGARLVSYILCSY
jgi:hypothetical protein